MLSEGRPDVVLFVMNGPALSLSISADVVRVPPGAHSFHVVFEIRANDMPAVEKTRTALALVLAIDISGSMAGPPMEHVVSSIEKIVDALAPSDRLGIVAFSNRACRVVAQDALDATQRRLVRGRTARLLPQGNTNIEDGLRAAHAMASVSPEGFRRAVVLLSDGQPNIGLSRVDELRDLARTMRKDASIATLGFGRHHDEDVLSAISDGGGGVYRYIADPLLARLQMMQAIGTQADVVAEHVELIITPEPQARIESFVGDAAPSFGADGIVVPLPDLLARGSRIVVARVDAKLADPAALGRVLRARLRWKTPGAAAKGEIDARLAIDVGAGPIEPDFGGRARVLLARIDETRRAARQHADRGHWEGAATVLRSLLSDVEAFLAQTASHSIGEIRALLEEGREIVVDEVAAMERRPSAEAYAQLRKQSQVVSSCDLASVRRSNAYGGQAFTAANAGELPKADLVVVHGPRQGDRHRLGATCTLGRTAHADVVIQSDAVSRRQAEIFFLEGDFWIADLGSTNPTTVGGRPLGHAPHKLESGDVIGLGGVLLLFDLPAPRKEGEQS